MILCTVSLFIRHTGIISYVGGGFITPQNLNVIGWDFLCFIHHCLPAESNAHLRDEDTERLRERAGDHRANKLVMETGSNQASVVASLPTTGYVKSLKPNGPSWASP